ncbi:acetyltransferase [Roseivirga sp.]|uniref:acetyltransferase n=1 Tax=Roseivirga sp. TaxID=1964215 RepID=UPI003B51BDA1
MKCVIAGTSGQAKVVYDMLKLVGGTIKFFLAKDHKSTDSFFYQFPIEMDEGKISPSDHLVVAIGDNRLRMRLTQRVQANYIKLLHPAAIISGDSTIGGGTVIMPGAVVNCGTTIGKHCIINTSASIDHDCHVDDFVHISPNATLCGKVKIGEGAHIGAGAIAIPNVTVGKWSTVGAGSVLIKDVPDYAVVVGNPAKVIRYNNGEN